MKKLALKIDDIIPNTIINHLLTIKGIKDVKLKDKDSIIEINYMENEIGSLVIEKEVMLFLGLIQMPSLMGFNKYSTNKLTKYNMIIKDLCCEYCLKGNIEELLGIKGIEKVSTDFDFINKKNVKIEIDFDEEIINLDKVKEIEKKFN